MSDVATFRGLGSPHGQVSLDIEMLSTASTTITLTVAQQGKLLVFDGGIRQINLPRPQEGMVFNLMNTSGGVSTPTKVLSTGDDIDIACNNTTAQGVACGSTGEGWITIQLVAVSDYRWVAFQLGAGSTSINSTST